MIVDVAGDADAAAVTVSVEEYEGVPDAGLNAADKPAGNPDALRLTLWGGPVNVFTVTV